MIGSLLVGGGFLCAVQLSLQCGRELAPSHTRYLAGLLTTGYAIGQLVGPVTSALSSHFTGQQARVVARGRGAVYRRRAGLPACLKGRDDFNNFAPATGLCALAHAQ